MFRTLFLAAVLAAFCAGLVTSVVQHFRLTPLIVAAESYEGDHGAEHAEEEAEEWMPADGFERTAYTVLANLLLAAGFAFVIAAVSIVFALPITPATGVLWGMGGFLAFSLAPAFGLPPGLPGMPVADTLARQIWWAGTAVATGAALVLLARSKAGWAIPVAIVLIVVPHLIGAPQPPAEETGVPAPLAASFAAAVLFNGAVFWVVLGAAFGFFNQRFATRVAA